MVLQSSDRVQYESSTHCWCPHHGLLTGKIRFKAARRIPVHGRLPAALCDIIVFGTTKFYGLMRAMYTCKPDETWQIQPSQTCGKRRADTESFQCGKVTAARAATFFCTSSLNRIEHAHDCKNWLLFSINPLCFTGSFLKTSEKDERARNRSSAVK